MNRDNGYKIAAVIVGCILLAVVSFFVAGRILSMPESYSNILQSINEKVQSVLKLTASSTAVSVGITAVPGDIGTPIAEKFADFSEYGILILCVLYAEKYLLTILGSAVFKYIIPVACILFALSYIRKLEGLKQILVKIAVVSMALYFVIPLSVHVSNLIYGTYQASIDSTISAAEDLADETAAISDAGEDQNAIQQVLNFFSDSTSGVIDRAGEILNRFIESLAVMIVTSCLIPLLVLAFSMWMINQVLGTHISVPRPRRKLRAWPRRATMIGSGSSDEES